VLTYFTRNRPFFSCAALIFFAAAGLHAQDTLPKETVVKQVSKDSATKIHSPKKAAIFSACLPGLGQAYNKKYWKIPVLYAGMGAFGYFIHYTHGQYRTFKDAYVLRTDGDSTTIDDQPDYSESQLKENVDFYRRYRDLNIILLAAVYALNIVDANVDAHLFTFDVSNDLSMEMRPSLHFTGFSGKPVTQLGICIKF
jgi:hypothetical protein